MKKWIFGSLCFVLGLFLGISEIQAVSKLDCNSIELSYNDTGSDVRLLQTELNLVTDCMLEVDGVFGSKTKQCVLLFQEKRNLEIDGIVGKKTCRKINTLYKKELNKNYMVVVASELNVRTKRTVDSAIKGTVSQGDVLRIYGSKVVNGDIWYKIKFKGTSSSSKWGYIHGDYVRNDAIVLNIETQRLTYYKDGKVYMEVPVVTGTKGSHDTPVGRYMLQPADKITSTTLRGYNDDGSRYNAYVDYWMPFINSRAIGFHDATWRSIDEFNSETYLNDGSHGCVNMRSFDAKKLYESTTEAIDVLVVAS